MNISSPICAANNLNVDFFNSNSEEIEISIKQTRAKIKKKNFGISKDVIYLQIRRLFTFSNTNNIIFTELILKNSKSSYSYKFDKNKVKFSRVVQNAELSLKDDQNQTWTSKINVSIVNNLAHIINNNLQTHLKSEDKDNDNPSQTLSNPGNDFSSEQLKDNMLVKSDEGNSLNYSKLETDSPKNICRENDIFSLLPGKDLDRPGSDVNPLANFLTKENTDETSEISKRKFTENDENNSITNFPLNEENFPKRKFLAISDLNSIETVEFH